jgi:hypothetical protein
MGHNGILLYLGRNRANRRLLKFEPQSDIADYNIVLVYVRYVRITAVYSKFGGETSKKKEKKKKKTVTALNLDLGGKRQFVGYNMIHILKRQANNIIHLLYSIYIYDIYYQSEKGIKNNTICALISFTSI